MEDSTCYSLSVFCIYNNNKQQQHQQHYDSVKYSTVQYLSVEIMYLQYVLVCMYAHVISLSDRAGLGNVGESVLSATTPVIYVMAGRQADSAPRWIDTRYSSRL